MLFLFIRLWFTVGNPRAPSSPFGYFLAVPIADLHALIKETGRFGESFDDKMGFASNALHAEVEPRRDPIGISLLL